jgi:hypothetical protein
MPTRWSHGDDEFRIAGILQPHFKLHASIDIQSDRNLTLVLGGDKEAEIDKHPILRAYHDQFRRRPNLRNARLMIIGYSFAASSLLPSGQPQVGASILSASRF